MKLTFLFALSLIVFSCARRDAVFPDASTDIQSGEPHGQTGQWVVKARATLPVVYSDRGWGIVRANGTQPVDVTLAPNVTFTLDSSKFSLPTISNAPLDFGNLRISELFDNNLNVCGAGANKKCGTAAIKVYTTGTKGAGIYNSTVGWGAPLTATLTTPLTVGLEVGNAAVMQTVSIGLLKFVLRLSDFATEPNYNFDADFTEAAAGKYSTTIVVEYALAE